MRAHLSPRLTGLRGRHDDMLIVRGVNLHPSQVEHVLLSVDGAAPHYRLIVERPAPMDELALECEPAGGADREPCAPGLEQRLREHTGLRIGVSGARARERSPQRGQGGRGSLDRRVL